MSKKVAVVLSGCGYLDGGEISESVFTLLALSKREAEITLFAPNIDFDEIDHITLKSTGKRRNSLVEAGRIARGKILNLSLARADDFDALIIPGGFGAAQLLSNFAKEGAKGKVHEKLKVLIHDFHSQKKGIGAICIAPAILALLFGAQKIKLTIGNDEKTINEIEKTGAIHIQTPPTSTCIDFDLKVATTPAYMYDQASAFDVFVGIDLCIEEVLNF